MPDPAPGSWTPIAPAPLCRPILKLKNHPEFPFIWLKTQLIYQRKTSAKSACKTKRKPSGVKPREMVANTPHP